MTALQTKRNHVKMPYPSKENSEENCAMQKKRDVLNAHYDLEEEKEVINKSPGIPSRAREFARLGA